MRWNSSYMLHIFNSLLLEQLLSLWLTQMLHRACYHFSALLWNHHQLSFQFFTWEDSQPCQSSFLWILNDSIINSFLLWSPRTPVLVSNTVSCFHVCFLIQDVSSPLGFSYLVLGNGIEFWSSIILNHN